MTFSRDAADQERLIGYVRAALAALDAGSPVDPVALCAEHPHLARPLAEVLGLAADLPLLQQEALREDPLAGLLLVGRYRLEQCLGRGAMGVVYRAEDQELRRAVAVKILDARLFRDPQAEQRFQREGEALAALHHPHTVAVYDRGRTPEGIHFLVMELLEGATLATLLERIAAGRAPIAVAGEIGGAVAEQHWPRLVARWAAALARGLAAAHERGLVHRDVKPSNVFVDRTGRPVLLDFGIAARGNDAAERLTATQTTLGTPWYMAPEQVRQGGLAVAEPTLDIYGLGATVYHLLAGRPPYEGDAAAVLLQLQTRDPAALGAIRPEVPRDLQAIVECCLERDPARRYPTGLALAADLDAFLEHRPVQARPLSALARRWRSWRRAPARPVAVGAGLVVAAVLAIALPIQREQRRLADQRQKDELYATLPSVLAIEGWPDERVVAELRGEHQTAIELLDRILALDPADLPVRLWRGCLWLDLGDRARATADLQAIAAAGSSPYLQGLAQRYLAADPQQLGAFAIDLDGLPAPVTPIEGYVAGLHELRARHRAGFAARAEALLSAAAPSYLPARDLRLLAAAELADQARTVADRDRWLAFVHDESIALEALYGRPTARTLAMRGVALIGQKRYADAVVALERSLALRPARHGPHQNLGIALLRLGRLDDAQPHLDTALQLRPFAWNTRYTLAQLAQARGDLGLANEWAAKVPTTGHAGQEWKQPNLRGLIAIDEAMASLRTDAEASRAAAQRAIAAFDEALRAQPNSRGLLRRRQIAEALQSGDLGKACVAFARSMVDDPNDPDDALQWANLAFLVPPDGLGPEGVAWLAAVLRRQAAARAGGNEVLRARLRAEIDASLKGYR